MLQKDTHYLKVIPSQIKEANGPVSDIHQSYEYCMTTFAYLAKSFYFASRYLQPDERRSIAALYAFCRMADDLVDDVNLEPCQVNDELDQLLSLVKRIDSGENFEHPILTAFGDTLSRFRIPLQYLYELIEGLRMDVHLHEMKTVQELDLYCYRVASTVGIMMCYIWRCTKTEILCNAAELGKAMQQTNILRDIGEDYDKGRIYIPVETRETFGVTLSDFESRIITSNFKSLLKHEITSIRKLYRSTGELYKFLPPAASFTVRVASHLYSEILREIEKIDYQIFKTRVFVPNWKKTFIVFKCRFQSMIFSASYARDPFRIYT